ncbi:hypothetical protein [Polaromonas sp. UC242_47]|uniref:hypothetical protein n=1 Tax=Polaromonas sp. UC242_47 TaxID=3374626 RepID=UPI00379DE022
MSGVLLLEQAVAYVRASFTKAQVKDVRAYAGEFSTAEMKNVSYNCPAILISLLGWKKPDEGGRLTGRHAKNHRMVAFVVTKNAKSREARMTEAMRLAEDLSVLLRQWAPMAQQPYASAIQAQGVTIVGLDDEPTCENLYNRAVDEQGQALWMVDWYQCAKGVIPLNQERPDVPYADRPNMRHVEIYDTARGGQAPGDTPDTSIVPDVQEKIDFEKP